MDMVSQALYTAALDMCRIGGTVLLQVGDTLQAVSPEGWYVLAEGGHVLVSFSTSAQAMTPDPDRMTAIVVADTGAAAAVVSEWHQGMIGPRLGTEAAGRSGRRGRAPESADGRLGHKQDRGDSPALWLRWRTGSARRA